ncbi:MAG: transposase [Gemmataceae bacterium]|nr:transposase [Gemmataceae bacterium]
MRAFSLDLRTRVLADFQAGPTFAELGRKYSTSAEWVGQFIRRFEATGEVDARPPRDKRVPFHRRYEPGRPARHRPPRPAGDRRRPQRRTVPGLRRAATGQGPDGRRHRGVGQLASHKVAGIREAIEGVGAMLVYLSPYSPDLNPIEQAFAKIKHEIRKHAPRTKPECDALCGECLDWLDEAECRNYIRHAGYGSQK